MKSADSDIWLMRIAVWSFEMWSLKVFLFGAIYLVSGIYSLGLSLFMEGMVAPISGYTAFVMVPDPLFSYEVALFVSFGGIFIAASFFEFMRSFRLTGRMQVEQT